MKFKFTKIRTDNDTLNRIQDALSAALSSLRVDSIEGTEEPVGVNTLTITNGPSTITGNPTGYIKIKVDGEYRIIPYW